MGSWSPPPGLAGEKLAAFERAATVAFDLLAALSTPYERDNAPLGFFERRRHRKAEGLVAECAALAPEAGATAWLRARLAHTGGDLDGAAKCFAEAAALEAHQPELHREWATVGMCLGRGDLAEQAARTAVDLAPERDDLKVHYAWALLVAGHPKRALGVVANVCKRDPNNDAARNAIETVRKIINGDLPPLERL